MNVASLELCKELYELSKWQKASFFWIKTEDVEDATYFGEYQDWVLLSTQLMNHLKPDSGSYPAYDLGYLLRKLQDFEVSLSAVKLSDGLIWIARCETQEITLRQQADIPENAVAKLCVQLWEVRVLK